MARLDPVLCNAGNWTTVDSTLSLNSTEQFTAQVTFKQELLAEFDSGDVHTYATMTDGSYILVDKEYLTLTSTATQSLQLDLSDGVQGGTVHGFVPFNADNVDDLILAATWTDQCTGGTIATGVGPVTVDLPVATQCVISASELAITRTSDAAACDPINLPSR